MHLPNPYLQMSVNLLRFLTSDIVLIRRGVNMEQSFSQRMGFISVKKVFQVDSMNEDLRTALWNDFYNYLWTKFPGTTAYSVYSYMTDIWTSYFRKAVDQVPDLAVFLYHVSEYFFEC